MHDPQERVREGIARTFQNLELFEDLTVRENILAALDGGDVLPYLTDLIRPGRSELSAHAATAVRMLDLAGDLDRLVSDLPHGRRRLVAIVRLIAQRPAVFCLDEPAAGLSGPERTELSRVCRWMATELGAAVLLVEHNVDVVAEVCDELVVLDFGRVIARGLTVAVLADPVVKSAYLGTRPAPARPTPASGEARKGPAIDSGELVAEL
jgi:sulfate-transporting ATPase